MREGWPLAAAVLIAFAALLVKAVDLPDRVFACSCMGPPPAIADLVREADITVVVGTVGRALPDRTPIAVTGWLHGASAQDVIWLSGGTNMATSCDVMMSPGDERVLVLYHAENGLYSTNLCAPGAELRTPEGQALLAEAVAVFGEPETPPTAPPEALQPAPAPSPWLGDGLIWAAGASAAGLLLLAAVVLLARRRQAC